MIVLRVLSWIATAVAAALIVTWTRPAPEVAIVLCGLIVLPYAVRWAG